MEMRKAILIKRKTDDGMIELKDHLKLGIEYYVDIESIIAADGFNTPTQTPWSREIILCDDGQWLPTEFLDIEGLI